jgi:hypothetical protein
VDARGSETTFYMQFDKIKDTLQFEITRVPCRQLFHNISTKNFVITKRQYFYKGKGKGIGFGSLEVACWHLVPEFAG